MNRRLAMIVMFMSIAIVGSGSARAARQTSQRASRQDHINWVSDVLKRMQTIKVGMTRADLLKVFTTEGGISGRLRRTFVSQDCPYFKVDVEFSAAGQPGRNREAGVTPVEDNQDIIVKISTPYLQFSIMD